jgi:hypothetical protein
MLIQAPVPETVLDPGMKKPEFPSAHSVLNVVYALPAIFIPSHLSPLEQVLSI